MKKSGISTKDAQRRKLMLVLAALHGGPVLAFVCLLCVILFLIKIILRVTSK